MKQARAVTISGMVLALSGSWAMAQQGGGLSGADLLLSGVKGSQKGPAAEGMPMPTTGFSDFKLNDPFSVQLYSSWQAIRRDLAPEINHWVTLQLKRDFEAAAHLWSGIEKQLPSAFLLPARLAHLRGLLELGLVQAGVEEWMVLLSQSAGAWTQPGQPSALVSAFESSWSVFLGRPLDQVLFDRGFSAPAEVSAALMKLDPKALPSLATLQAAASLRKGEQGRELLDLLPAGHAYQLPLARTVALAAARRGDLATAATVLKTHAESALESERNLLKVSSHLLQIARFLFQAGLWEEAETYLRKIPNSAPEFLTAREELAWVLLRRGDITNLRGEIASLSTPATKDAFQPELPVVRAISNLKLCSFGAVERDFADFQSHYGAWARRIESALSATETPAPATKDAFTMRAEKRAEVLASDSQRLEELHRRSLQSGLPSVVGQQAHWKVAADQLKARVEASRKTIRAEYRRQWKNQQALLLEAIRKLRFVKIELLHQVRTLAATQMSPAAESDAISLSQAAPRPQDGQLVFPLDGVLWPDEFFRIQSVAEQRCLKGLTK